MDVVRFRELTVAAPKPAFWNSIMSCRTQMAVRRRCATFSCAVAAIINTRPIYGPGNCELLKSEKRERSSARESNSVWTELGTLGARGAMGATRVVSDIAESES